MDGQTKSSSANSQFCRFLQSDAIYLFVGNRLYHCFDSFAKIVFCENINDAQIVNNRKKLVRGVCALESAAIAIENDVSPSESKRIMGKILI